MSLNEKWASGLVIEEVMSLNEKWASGLVIEEKMTEDTSNNLADQTVVVKQEINIEEPENYETNAGFKNFEWQPAEHPIKLEMKDEDLSDYSGDEFGVIDDFECFEVMLSEGTLPYKVNVETIEELSDEENVSYIECQPSITNVNELDDQILTYVHHFGNISVQNDFPIKVEFEEELEMNNEEAEDFNEHFEDCHQGPRKKTVKSDINTNPQPPTPAKKHKNRGKNIKDRNILNQVASSPGIPMPDDLNGEVIAVLNMGWDCYFTAAPNQVIRNVSTVQILNGFLMSLEELTSYGVTGERLEFFRQNGLRQLCQNSAISENNIHKPEGLESNQISSEGPIKYRICEETTKDLLIKFFTQIKGNFLEFITFTHVYKMPFESLEKVLKSSLKYLELEEDYCSFKKSLMKDYVLNFNHLHMWDRNKYSMESIVKLFRSQRPFLGFVNLKAHILGKVAKPNNEPLPIPIKVWTCQVCRFESTSLNTFLRHFLKESAFYTYLCRRCGFLKFNNICTLLYHVLIDSKETIAELCLACGKQYPSLIDHLTETTDDAKSLKCHHCNFTTKDKCLLDYHEECHKNFFFWCSKCKDVFYNSEQLQFHSSHCIEDYVSTLLFCPCCMIFFSKASHFEIHIHIDHYLRINYCSQCKIGFRNVDRIKKHVNLVHPQGSHKILNLCTICPKNTFRGQRKWVHFSDHTKEKRLMKKAYYCQCNLITLSKQEFMEHFNFYGHCTKQATPLTSLFLKECSKCNFLKSYNFTKPFCCEKCQDDSSRKKYMCTKCNYVIDYDFDLFLNHFFVKHPTQKEQPVKDSSFKIVEFNDKQLKYFKTYKNIKISRFNCKKQTGQEAIKRKQR